jgi:hypothetical protein
MRERVQRAALDHQSKIKREREREFHTKREKNAQSFITSPLTSSCCCPGLILEDLCLVAFASVSRRVPTTRIGVNNREFFASFFPKSYATKKAENEKSGDESDEELWFCRRRRRAKKRLKVVFVVVVVVVFVVVFVVVCFKERGERKRSVDFGLFGGFANDAQQLRRCWWSFFSSSRRRFEDFGDNDDFTKKILRERPDD